MLSSGYLKCRTCTILLLLYACTLEIYIYFQIEKKIKAIFFDIYFKEVLWRFSKKKLFSKVIGS